MQSLTICQSTSSVRRRRLGERLSRLDPQLEAFSHLDIDRALRHAAALDALHASGVSLGPLMGMPIAIKDLCTVDGMPTKAGSQLDVQDLVPPQGGFNLNRPPPWNPCDLNERRMTGRSSHGSAVAMAAELLAFLGRERVAVQGGQLNLVAAARLEGGLTLHADEYVRMLGLRRRAEHMMNERAHLFDV